VTVNDLPKLGCSAIVEEEEVVVVVVVVMTKDGNSLRMYSLS
jgi:hypothetical protein